MSFASFFVVVARQVGFVKLEDLGVLWKYANVHTPKKPAETYRNSQLHQIINFRAFHRRIRVFIVFIITKDMIVTMHNTQKGTLYLQNHPPRP